VQSDVQLPTTDTTAQELSQNVTVAIRRSESEDIDTLLPLAMSHPSRALLRAREVLAAGPGPREASIAHQTIAIVERDSGRVASALNSARQALIHARHSDNGRVADVLATMGTTLGYAGRTRDALRRLQEAERLTPPEQRPGLLVRRADVRFVAGRYVEALADLDLAVTVSRRLGDSLWEARALDNRGLLYLAMGHVTRADADAVRAERLFNLLGQQLESAYAVHNRALIAHQRGELVEALQLIETATARYADIDVVPVDLAIDHALMLLTAGLTNEARVTTRVALGRRDLQPAKRAELLLRSAQAALAEGDLDGAAREADAAAKLFRAQQRPRWAHRARLSALQTRYLAAQAVLRRGEGPESGVSHPLPVDGRRLQRRLLRDSARVMALLEDDHAPDLAMAQLLHGRIARDAAKDDEAQANFKEAARARHSGSGLARSAGWLAAALLADLRGDRRALLHACLRGLDAVDEHRALMGDLELRALASRHGNELATLAFRSKVAEGDTRGMLWWVERWRATGLGVTPVRPIMDTALERDLAALRNVTRRLERMTEDDPLGPVLRQEQARRETAVRGAYRRKRGQSRTSPGLDLRRVIGLLGDRQLIALVQDQDLLYSLVVREGRVRRRPILSTSEALREAHFARFALRRAAYGRIPDLDAVGRRLELALLGPTRDLADREHTIVVPPSTLLTAPWGLLPVLKDHPITVVPSVTMWATATAKTGRTGHIALVTGPGLSTGEAEVTALSPLHDDARSIAGDEATVAAALSLLDGARLAHIAAHGTFRGDAPLFSSLELADGPLTMHDLERLVRPPRAMVLSACDTGNAAPIGANEALGLVTSLLAIGTVAVVASVVPVNDRATLSVMRHLHEVTGKGGSLAEGMRVARQEAAGDPLLAATAAAFTAWGA
jgi:tetratricopeptide (TPR) repeat protein